MRSLLEIDADQNLALAIRRHTLWQRQSRLEDTEGLLLHESAVRLPIAFLNCALRSDASLAPLEVVRRVDAFYADDSPHILITQSAADADLEAHLAANGFTMKGDAPAMLVERPVQASALGKGWQLAWVADDAGIADFIEICTRSYESLGLPAAVTPAYFAGRQGLLSDGVAIALARSDQGRAAACAMVLLDAPVSGIYWVGVLPQFRGLGLARACTAAATNRAFAHGSGGVTLQASAMGEALYRQMGFRETGRVRRWARARA